MLSHRMAARMSPEWPPAHGLEFLLSARASGIEKANRSARKLPALEPVIQSYQRVANARGELLFGAFSTASIVLRARRSRRKEPEEPGQEEKPAPNWRPGQKLSFPF
jgi:hypothetical protein